MNEGRFARQFGLFNPDDEANQPPILIVGAGTTGSWTALALAKMGLQHIAVVDFDKVEMHNIPNQFFSLDHYDTFKVEALLGSIYQYTDTHIRAIVGKFAHELLDGTEQYILISAVDNMQARVEMYEAIKQYPWKYKLFIDSRSGGNAAKIYTMQPSTLQFEKFATTLHSDDLSTIQNAEVRALSDVPCTARSVVDVSLLVAGTIANAVRRYLVNNNIMYEQIIDATNGFTLTSQE